MVWLVGKCRSLSCEVRFTLFDITYRGVKYNFILFKKRKKLFKCYINTHLTISPLTCNKNCNLFYIIVAIRIKGCTTFYFLLFLVTNYIDSVPYTGHVQHLTVQDRLDYIYDILHSVIHYFAFSRLSCVAFLYILNEI